MKRCTWYLIGSCLAVFSALLWIRPGSIAAQAQQSTSVLVIQGGTLIDGNGGPPVQNALVVIQGNKIQNVSQKGKISYPPAAQVIDATGKFILPGYWETELTFWWYVGESELNHGVTSVSDIGEGGDIAMLQNKAIQYHRINWPRMWTGIARIGALVSDYNDDTESFTTPFRAGQYPKSAEDGRQIAKRMLDAGAELVNYQGGSYPLQYYRAVIDEAHKAGKPVFVRPGGPIFNVRDAIDMNADILSHSDGIALAVAKDPSKFSEGVTVTGLEVGTKSLATDELDVYADMDDAKAAELIKLLVQHKITLEPTMIRKGAGFHKENEIFQAEARDWWESNPNLRVYFPEGAYQSEILEMTPKVMSSEEWARRMKGYQNMMRFHGNFVKAGGHLTIGCNSPHIRPPGLCLHQELQLFADAGLTPMQLIEAATKWPAEAYGALNQLGTIEAGKMADLVILDADPLQDHRNLQNINSVIYNGQVQELGYHADYALHQPFKGGEGLDLNLIVEDLQWVSAYKKAKFRAGAAVPAAPPGGQVRVNAPAIEAISPYLVEEGSPSVVLTINGFFFDEKCLVYFDNKIVPFTLVSPTEMHVTLDESLLRRAGVFDVFIKQPGPLINQQSWHARDGLSNKARFLVDFKY